MAASATATVSESENGTAHPARIADWSARAEVCDGAGGRLGVRERQVERRRERERCATLGLGPAVERNREAPEGGEGEPERSDLRDGAYERVTGAETSGGGPLPGRNL